MLSGVILWVVAAGAEWYFGYQGCCFGDLQQEDWRVAEVLWQKGKIAIDFFYENLPFEQMEPDNTLTQSVIGSSWTFAKEGEIYAVYLMDGAAENPELNLAGSTDTFNVLWFDPDANLDLQPGTVHQIVGPDNVNLGLPPGDISKDWVALVEIGISNPPPLFVPIADAVTVEDGLLEIAFEVIDYDSATTITSQVVRDVDGVVMDNSFYSFTDNLDGSGSLEFMPPLGETGTYTVTLTADDGVNPLEEYSFALDVLGIGASGVLVIQSDGLTRTSGNGLNDSILVYLNAEPTDTVIVNVVSGDLSEILIEPVQLTFDDTNWSVPQEVTLIGQNNSNAIGNVYVVITFDTGDSLDVLYAALEPLTVIAVNNDEHDRKNSKNTNRTADNDTSDTAVVESPDGGNGIQLEITSDSPIFLLNDTVTWQIRITNGTNQPITDAVSNLKFSSPNITILDTQASTGILSTDFVAKLIYHRRLQTRNQQNRFALRPLVNHSVTSINPSQSINLTITTRLDEIPDTLQITLNGGITANSNDNLIAQDQLSLPVVSILPNTGQTPFWRNIIVVGFILCGFLSLLMATIKFQ